MAKRKPDRIDRAAAKIVEWYRPDSPKCPPLSRRIAALVRREVKRERKAMREAVFGQAVFDKVSRKWIGHIGVRNMLDWLDAREAGR